MTPPPWTARVLTLYPAVFPGPLGAGPAGRALDAGLWRLETLDIRVFARDKHRTVDAPPFGGGPGMVMRADVLAAAIDAATGGAAGDDAATGGRARLCLTPRGRPVDRAAVRRWAGLREAVLVCGRFEGIDERVVAARGLEEVSVGDFVMAGGEIAAMAVIDACVRLLPGVIGDAAGLEEESFEAGLLEYPHYTRPQRWEGREAPPVLLSGDHAAIRRWRREESLRATRTRRPDLWRRHCGRHGPNRTTPDDGTQGP